MYKVLIVDDEAWVVKSLQMAVDWNAHGFEVIGSAADGAEALAYIEEWHPDLIITDIRMPVMGGLELMEKARTRWPLLEFVIVSVHAEFDYARRAINYGAVGYCLKPIDEQEMTEMLRKVKSRIELKASAGLDIFMLLEQASSYEEILRYLAERGIQWSDQGMRVVYGELPEWPTFHKISNIYILREFDLENLPSPSSETSLGISSNLKDPMKLGEAVIEAQIASKQYFMTGSHGIYEYTFHSRTYPRSRIAAVASAANDKNIQRIQNELSVLLIELKSGDYNIKHAYHCFFRLCDVLDMQQSDDQDYEMDSYRELAQSFPDVTFMIQFFQDQFLKQYDALPDASPIPDVIKKIVVYLDEHYAEDISLTNLSDQYHLTPSYLCRIFKRECGKTLTGYLVDRRLENACQLLRKTNLPVNQIAKTCGYDDYFYFARLFKRTFGITPSQFRESIRVDGETSIEFEIDRDVTHHL